MVRKRHGYGWVIGWQRPELRHSADRRPAKRHRTAGIKPDGNNGFTLLELLVVLAILVTITIVAVPRVIGYLDRAKSDSAAVAIENLATTLDLYRLDVGRYPSQSEGLSALVAAPEGAPTWNGPYLRKEEMLIDPWGNPYRYTQPGKHGAFDVYSLGADNAEGGDGADADVVSW